MSCIDLNMVRAGVVEDPLQWQWSGYHEIQRPPQRYRRVDSARTAELLGMSGPEELRTWQKDAAREMSPARGKRDQKWTESIAVGSEAFVRDVQRRLGLVGNSREVKAEGDSFVLRERAAGKAPRKAPGGREPTSRRPTQLRGIASEALFEVGGEVISPLHRPSVKAPADRGAWGAEGMVSIRVRYP
jgi:hypothetical protein